MSEFKLTEKQALTKHLVDEGHSIFLTGSGGVGKSVTVRSIINNDTMVVAPTGVAAVNVGGVTAHSLFGLPFGVVIQSDYQKPISKSMEKKLKKVKRIVFDEISMVRSDMLDLIDHKLKQVKGNGKPFGGIQIIFVGDFFQLSPVVTYQEKSQFYKKYESEFCFTSRSWKTLNPRVIELTKVLRQSDQHQIGLLQMIRRNENVSEAVKGINDISAKEEGDDFISLCSFNKDAELLNNFWYKQNRNKEFIYSSDIKGKISNSDKPVPDEVKLKVGCKVVICANNFDNDYANGDRGEVISMSPFDVTVRKLDGTEVVVAAHEWPKFDYDIIGGSLERVQVGTYVQIPLLLGYAISVHKSQGMTLDGYNIDLGAKGAFAHGQAYVALSRAKDLTRIHFQLPLKVTDIICDPKVKEFYNGTSED